MDSFSYFHRAFSCAYITSLNRYHKNEIYVWIVILNKSTKQRKIRNVFYVSCTLLRISWKNMISIYEHLKGTLSSACIRGTCHDDRTLAAIRFEWYVCYNLTYSTIIDVVLLVMLSLCVQHYLRRRILIQFWLYMNITFVLLNYLNNLWYTIYGLFWDV